jgi:solute carrier family 9 (sodium/hydrogen exchanger), member 8
MTTLGRYLTDEGGSSEPEEDDTFGWTTHAFTREEEVIVAEYLLAFIVLLVSTLLLQFFVGKIWKLTYLPESGATILFGMVIGGIIRLSGTDTSGKGDDWQGSDLLGFNTTLFFIGFLPPIIFNAGYMIKRRLFFANLGGILSLAFIGTTISAWLVGYGLWAAGQGGVSYQLSIMEAICFGSLISATDPVSTLAVFTELRVDPTLFYLVFGESVPAPFPLSLPAPVPPPDDLSLSLYSVSQVMNDAVAITLFRTTGKFVGVSIGADEFFIALVDFVLSFAGSVIIGYVLGLFSAWIFKTVDMSHHRLVLVSVFVGMVYIPFFLAGYLSFFPPPLPSLFSTLALSSFCISSFCSPPWLPMPCCSCCADPSLCVLLSVSLRGSPTKWHRDHSLRCHHRS